MAIRTNTEIMDALRGYLGEDTSDIALALVEDFNDTMAEYERQIADVTDWQARYDALDKEWRTRYRDRFFEAGAESEDASFIDDIDVLEETADSPTTFEELFEEVKE